MRIKHIQDKNKFPKPNLLPDAEQPVGTVVDMSGIGTEALNETQLLKKLKKLFEYLEPTNNGLFVKGAMKSPNFVRNLKGWGININQEGDAFFKKVTAGTYIKVFLQDDIPTSLHVGDIWYDTNDDNKMYVAECIGADQITAGEWVHRDYPTEWADVLDGASTKPSNNATVGANWASNLTNIPEIRGWSHDLVFSATDLNTVSWALGTLNLPTGDNYNIDAGNTGNMAARTYIYFNKSASETVLQTSTTASDAVGANKILIAIAKNSTNEATFQVFGGIGGFKIDGADLENLTVEEAKVAADAITATKIAVAGLDGTSGSVSTNHIIAGMIQTNAITSVKITADAVTASKINVVGLDGTSGRIVVADATDANAVTGGINSHAVTLIEAGKIVISGATNLSDWRNATDATKIEGGSIYTNTITATQIAANTVTANEIAANTITAGEIFAGTITTTELSFTPVQSTDVIAKINASAEGILIAADNITIAGTTTFAAGWAAAANAEADINGSNIVNGAGWTDDTAADAKAKVYRQDAAPGAGMSSGDIWIDTNDGNRPYSYSGAAWVETLTIIDGGKITTGTIDASVVTVSNLNAGNISTGTLVVARTEAKCTDALADQTSAHQGDINGSNIVNGAGWTDDTAADAAQASADSKPSIFRQTTAPVAGMIAGSIWIDTDDGDRVYTYSGAAWVESLTVIDGDHITTGTILVARTQAKCTDANADQTSAHTANNATNYTGNTISTSYTTAKCTDANADETSTHTSADTNKVQNYTLMTGGLINTGRITCDNINAGTLTGRTVQTHSGSTTGSKLVAGAGLRIYGDYATFYSSSTAVGHIHASSTANFQMYSYASKTLELGGAAGAWLNAGAGSCQLRYGNTAVIYANGTNYSGYVGTSSNHFASMYAQTYNLGRSGKTTKYIQMGAAGNIEVNTDFYVGGALSKASGTFKIDHPLKPKTHWLEHSFVESPDMLNVYTKNAIIKGGMCKITMPDWFIPLNGKRKSNYRYQLTSIGQENSLWVQQEMNNKGEVIFAGKKNGKFSYSIFGIRHDKWAREHRVKVETKKIN